MTELVTLPRTVLAGDDRVFTITGKGGRERLVPLNGSARRALTRYLDVGSNVSDGVTPMLKTKWLFPSRGAEGHLTRQRFAQELKALCLEAGIDPERVSPHVLRHAFASHLARSRGGFARRSAAARPRRYIHDTNLYACAGGAAAPAGARSSSAGTPTGRKLKSAVLHSVATGLSHVWLWAFVATSRSMLP